MSAELSPADREKLLTLAEAVRELRKEIERFRGYHDSGYPQHRERVKRALERVLELEREYLRENVGRQCLYPLLFGYGDIAEAYLQLEDLERALIYACAYLEINRIAEDTEGVRAAYKVLSDVAVVAGDTEAFKRFWKKSAKGSDEIYRMVLRNLRGRKKKMSVPETYREKPPSFQKLAGNFPLYVLSKEMGVSVERVRQMLNS